MTSNEQVFNEVLTVNEAANFLRVERTRILGLLELGRLSGLKLADGDWRISKNHLFGLLDGNQPPTSISNAEAEIIPIKIGVMVRQAFETMLAKNTLPTNELLRLQNLSYCKNTFGVNFPVLRQVVPWCKLADQRRVGRHPRYWKQVFSGDFLVTSEWYEWQRGRFLDWLARFKGADNGRF